jgi:hypothetical protein
MAFALTHAQNAAFETVLDRLNSDDRARVAAAARPGAVAAALASSHWDFCAPSAAAAAALGDNPGGDLRRGLIATWAQALPGRAALADLPDEVHALYPDWTDRLAAFLLDGSGDYDADYWAKDVRFALALSVPGAQTQTIDLCSRLGPGDVLRHARDRRDWGALAAYAGAKGWGSWLEVHTEARHLADFNEAGWDRAWETAAAILRRRPEMRGMTGSSWFYDPPLEQISPRLAYLRLNPTRNGAFMIHQGPGDIHTERASASPGSRRTLIEEGKYTPRSWIVAWPRAALLRWADARSSLRAAA